MLRFGVNKTDSTTKKKNKNSTSSLTWKSYVGPCAVVVILSIVLDRFDIDIHSIHRFVSQKMLGSTSSNNNHLGNDDGIASELQCGHNGDLSSTLQNLIRLTMCSDNADSSSCIYDNLLQVVEQTVFVGKRGIESNRKLLDIPRQDQIWTTDALRSFQGHDVFQNVLHARHPKTGKTLAPQAHLALYLAILKKQRSGASMGSDDCNNNASISQKDGATTIIPNSEDLVLDDHFLTSKQKIYLDLLPNYSGFDGVHPVTYSLRTLNVLFGSYTTFYFLVAGRKAEIESEYKALQKSIRDANNNNDNDDDDRVDDKKRRIPVSYHEYVAARLNVQTRSFQVGPLSYGSMSEELQQDLDLYRSTYEIPSTQEVFCSAMVPILDSLNHHHKNYNVQWKYAPGTHKFMVLSSRQIEAGAALHATYGDRDDLFATYGFINGDFSERTSSLMSLHKIVDTRVVPESLYINEQKSEILRYLQHDDGYLECVNEDTNEAGMEMKRLKRQAVLLLANVHTPWLVSFPPRDLDPSSSSVPIDDGMNQIVNTARLFALTHRDYDGTAPTILKDLVAKLKEARSPNEFRFTLDRGDDGLEYRTMVWLWRFAAFNLEKYNGVTSQDERETLAQLEANSEAWYASYVRYQELIPLETMKKYADQTMSQYVATLHRNPDLKEDFYFRAELCPVDTHALYELVNE